MPRGHRTASTRTIGSASLQNRAQLGARISSSPSAAHRRAALEPRRDWREWDIGPAFCIHELFPASIEQALVVLRNVALGYEPRIIRMRTRMAQAHRQLLRMPAPKPAGARFRHLPPVIDIVLLKKAGRPVIGLAPDADRALQLIGGIPVNEYEVPELGLERASRQSEP